MVCELFVLYRELDIEVQVKNIFQYFAGWELNLVYLGPEYDSHVYCHLTIQFS